MAEKRQCSVYLTDDERQIAMDYAEQIGSTVSAAIALLIRDHGYKQAKESTGEQMQEREVIIESGDQLRGLIIARNGKPLEAPVGDCIVHDKVNAMHGRPFKYLREPIKGFAQIYIHKGAKKGRYYNFPLATAIIRPPRGEEFR